MMIMAFLLVVIVDGATVSTPDMLFENVYECNKFANAIERGELGPNQRPYKWQENISAHCVPKMVREGTFLFR
tara:strand:+ start:565 stop:783 length:219 start_codon:yes stop_codon:yes gene_type:complete